MNKNFLRLAAALALATGASAALAATATNTLTVQATVKSVCTVAAATLNFGQYDPSTGTNLAVNQNISVTCTKGTPFTVAMNAGLPANGGSFAARVMKESGGNTLNYNLYLNAGLTTVWGDGTGTTSVSPSQTGTGLGTPVSLTVYGNIPYQPNAVPTATTYSDSVTMTVSY